MGYDGSKYSCYNFQLAGQQQDRQSSLPSLPLRATGLAKKSDADALRRRAISEAGPQPPNLSSLVSSESGVSDTKGGSRSSTPPVPPLPSSFGSSTTSSHQLHEKTECACLKSGDHYPKVVLDQTFPCTIESLYNLLYRDNFMKKFLTEQKNTGTCFIYTSFYFHLTWHCRSYDW